MVTLDMIADIIQQWSTPIAGLGSLILSTALVVLYRQQHKLLKRSYNADHRAVVEVEASEDHTDTLSLTLTNVGNGVATDLELVTATVFQPTDTLQPAAVIHRLQMERDFMTGRQAIKAGEDHVTFTARPFLGMRSPNGQANNYEIGAAMRHLTQADVELLRVHFFLRYQDLRGQFSIRYIDGYELEPDTDIDDFFTLTTRGARMVYGEPTVDPETLELDLSKAETSTDRTVV